MSDRNPNCRCPQLHSLLYTHMVTQHLSHYSHPNRTAPLPKLTAACIHLRLPLSGAAPWVSVSACFLGPRLCPFRDPSCVYPSHYGFLLGSVTWASVVFRGPSRVSPSPSNFLSGVRPVGLRPRVLFGSFQWVSVSLQGPSRGSPSFVHLGSVL